MIESIGYSSKSKIVFWVLKYQIKFKAEFSGSNEEKNRFLFETVAS